MTTREELKAAFAAGYRERELDIREDDRVNDPIIDKAFERYMRGQE